MTEEEGREAIRKIVDAVAEALRETAEQYERGQRTLCSPQEALRTMALEVETVFHARDDDGLFSLR